MQVLDLETAVAAYRQAGDSSMVLALEMVQHLEDCNLRAGHVLVLLGTNYDAAQELFLRSSDPKAALEMRKDLRHWEQALKLAEQLDPQSLGLVMAQYGMVLEAQGEAAKALHCYQVSSARPLVATPVVAIPPCAHPADLSQIPCSCVHAHHKHSSLLASAVAAC